MALRRYVGITRPLHHGKPVGWIAQCKRPRLWRSGFKTQAAAAQWLAKMLRKRVGALRRKTKGPHGPHQELGVSYYRGVVPIRRGAGGQCLWLARARRRHLGTFSSQAAAAAAVAKALGVTVKTLRKGMSANRARQVFRAAYRAFKGYRPGDLEHTRKQEVVYQRLFKQDLFFVFFSQV